MNHQHQEALKFINGCAPLQSLLYDMNLLPEQLKSDSLSWRVMLNIAVHFKMMEERAVAASTPPAPTGAASRAEDLEAMRKAVEALGAASWYLPDGEQVDKDAEAAIALLRERLEVKDGI